MNELRLLFVITAATLAACSPFENNAQKALQKLAVKVEHVILEEDKKVERKELAVDFSGIYEWGWIERHKDRAWSGVGSAFSASFPTLEIGIRRGQSFEFHEAWIGFDSADIDERLLLGYKWDSTGYLRASTPDSGDYYLWINLMDVPRSIAPKIKVVTLRYYRTSED